MSLQLRLEALVAAVGADIKSVKSRLTGVENINVFDGGSPSDTTQANSGSVVIAPTSGLLSGRPAASTGVGYYFATDINGGTLYWSNGANWTTLTAGLNVAGRKIVSATITSATTVPSGSFGDIAGLAMQIPAGIPHRVGLRYKWSSMQGTAASGQTPALQIKVVDTAAVTMYLFDSVQHTIATASNGKVITPTVQVESPDKAALAVATNVKVQALVSAITGLGAQTLDNGFGNITTEVYAVSA